MASQFQDILVIKLSSMGDVVHTLPAVCLLRDRFPDARIRWLIDGRFAPLLRGHPAVDEFLVTSSPDWVRRLGPFEHVGRGVAHLASLSRVTHENFDLVVDFQGLFKTGVLTAATRAPVRLGFANAREGATLAYTKTARIPIADHAVRRYLRLVESVAGQATRVRFDLPVRPEAIHAAKDRLDSHGIPHDRPYLVVAPRSARSEKNWPLDRFATVVHAIWQRWGIPAVLVGAHADRVACEYVANQSQARIASIVGEPLDFVLAVLQQSRLLLGLDSGPMHLAAALGTPVVSIFGPTDPARFAPWGSEHLVARGNVRCSACRFAALASHLMHDVLRHECIHSVTTDDVLHIVRSELEKSSVARVAG